MSFQFCWEFRNCTKECRARSLRVLFCWHISRETDAGIADCKECEYRRKWIAGEYTVEDFVRTFDRRRSGPRPKKILVIDDEPNILFALEEAVREKGYDCIAATDGEEGLVLARGVKPDLIITDVIMPKINGFELCQILKNDPDTTHIPIILVTVKARETDRGEGQVSGANAYLVKPFDLNELSTHIDRFIPPEKA